MGGSSNSTTSSLRSWYFDSDYSASGSSVESCYSDMSTPHRRGATGVTKATLDKLVPLLREDTDGKLFGGITIRRFVEHAWGVSPAEILQILSGKWILEADSLERYKSASSEPEMYRPFIEIVDALTTSVRDVLGKGESFMELFTKDGNYAIKNAFSTRKPDMISVLIKDVYKPNWLVVYKIVEFKKRYRAESRSNASNPSTSSLGGIPERASTSGRHPSKMAYGEPSTLHSKAGKIRMQSTSTSKGKKPTSTRGLTAREGISCHNTASATPFESTGTAGGHICAQAATASNKRKFVGSHSNTASKRIRSSDSNASHITNDQMQLATYALEAMAVSTRHYTTGVFVDKFIVSLWYYDRTCVIRTVNFDFREEPGTLALVFFAMSQCSSSTAGFDPFLFHNPATPTPSANGPVTNIIGSHFVFPPDGQIYTGKTSDNRFCVKSILSEYRGLIGRGTMVYRVSHLHKDRPDEDDRVLKLSWPLTIRTREATILATLLETIPEWKDHLPEVHFSSTYTAERLRLPRFELLKSHSEKHKLEDRDLHVLVMSLYQTMWEVDSVEEFQKIFVDCVECHHHAYNTGRILHRDLSENNLMFKRDADSKSAKGIVNDWDMASHLDSVTGEVLTSTARHRTGTIPFMAIDLLSADPPVHLYRHDLESFFYILVWAAIHFDIPSKKRLRTHPDLEEWDDDSLRKARKSKIAMISWHSEATELIFDNVREEFSGVLANWILPLWRLFNSAFNLRQEISFQDHAEPYDNETLGGRITFHTFMATLKRTPRTMGLS